VTGVAVSMLAVALAIAGAFAFVRHGVLRVAMLGVVGGFAAVALVALHREERLLTAATSRYVAVLEASHRLARYHALRTRVCMLLLDEQLSLTEEALRLCADRR